MANLVSSLFIRLTARTAEFQSGMQKAERRVQSTERQFSRATKAAKGFAQSLGLVIGVGTITRLANNAIQAGSAITDMATATQTGVEAVQALNYAAIQAGASQEQMANLLVRANKSANDAARGLSTATDAFELLNIDAQAFINLPTERKLEVLGRAFVEAGEGTREFGSLMDLLGTRNAPKLLEVLQRLGTEGFDAVAQEARNAGQVMREDTAQALDEAADAIEAFKTSVTVNIGEAIVFWKDLFAEIKKVNEELRRNSAGGTGIMAEYLPRIDDLEGNKQRLELIKELQGELKAASDALMEGNYNARTGGGYFDRGMREELEASIRSYQLLIRQLVTMELPEIAAPRLPAAGSITTAADDFLALAETLERPISTGFTDAVADATALGLELEDLAGDLQALAFEGFGNVKGQAKEAADKISQWQLDAASAVSVLADGLETGLVNAAMNGKAAFGDMAQFIMAEIQRILITSAPTRASGGPVTAGHTYRVNELGEEYFTPAVSGVISPAGGQGAGLVIGSVDMRGASVEAVARLEALLAQYNGSIEPRALAAVENMYQRNPAFLRR